MQIQNLNSLVDTVRHEIIECYRPGEDDPHLQILQAAHIYNKLSDVEFRQLVHILENRNSSKAMSARERNRNKKTAVAWYMFPCSSGFMLVLFSWECGSINLNLKTTIS